MERLFVPVEIVYNSTAFDNGEEVSGEWSRPGVAEESAFARVADQPGHLNRIAAIFSRPPYTKI